MRLAAIVVFSGSVGAASVVGEWSTASAFDALKASVRRIASAHSRSHLAPSDGSRRYDGVAVKTLVDAVSKRVR